jgi:PAS domain S-box-containing protein
MTKNTDPDENQQLLTELARLREQITNLETENQALAQSTRKMKDTLEQTVAARTAELLITNQKLHQEIVERKQTEDALRQSETRFHQFFNESLDALILIDETGKIFEWNRGAEKLTGLPATETVGQNLWDIQYRILTAENKSPARYNALKQMVQTALKTGDGTWLNKTVEVEFQRADGAKRFTRQRIFAIRAGNGFRLASISHDITDQVHYQQQLATERNLLRTIIDIIPDFIYARNKENRFIVSNIANARMLGAESAEDVLGKTDADFFPPEFAARFAADDRQVLESGRSLINLEEYAPDPTGVIHYVLTTKVPLRDQTGNIVGLAGIGRDITEFQETRAALERRNDELALLYQINQAATTTLDLDQVMEAVAEESRRLLQVTACSIWLLEALSGDLVCRYSTDLDAGQREKLRLEPGQGLAGWVVEHQISQVITNAQIDKRHYTGVDNSSGVITQSMLVVPLRTKGKVIGIFEAIDQSVDRFGPGDLQLMELLAATAAIAIENARLFRQTQIDAETKTRLLREVNHRVKNNLAAIISLLRLENEHAASADSETFSNILADITSRISGMATVHNLLSASEWMPLSVEVICRQIIDNVLQTVPIGKMVTATVTPSAIRVSPKQANSVALIINELATNSVKYCLAGRDKAQIQLFIDQETADIATLRFQDDGPGYPAETLKLERLNVGMQLIQVVAEMDLDGTVTLSNDNGAKTDLRFRPLSHD